jgi:hypothetical protein
VRARFAGKLESRIAAIEDALPHVCGVKEACIASVVKAHHQLHELCGLAPTVGFPETGRAARSMERLLLPPAREKRGLTAEEAVILRSGLKQLRAASLAEIGGAENAGNG